MRLHHILGEDGEVLTIMSLLQPAQRATDQPLGEMTLQEAIQRIYDIAGDEGRAQLVLSLRRTLTTDAFSTEEDVTVSALSDQLLQLAGENPDVPVVLSCMTQDDEPVDDDDEDDDDNGGFVDALHRFAQALRNLFNAGGDDGEPLTVLSLLVRQPTEPGQPPTAA